MRWFDLRYDQRRVGQVRSWIEEGAFIPAANHGNGNIARRPPKLSLTCHAPPKAQIYPLHMCLSIFARHSGDGLSATLFIFLRRML